MSHTAKAFEGCERTFKPVFADPKPQKNDVMKLDVMRGGDPRGDMRPNDGYGGGYPGAPFMNPHHNNPPNNMHHLHPPSPGFDALAHSEFY